MNMMTLRQWHGYIGVFIAPSVLFFALTGGLQLFSLHEAHDDYRPAPIIEKLSRVHKDQVFALGHHRAAPPPASRAAKPPAPEDRPRLPTLILKIFLFWFVALGLAISTVLGVWIAFTRNRRKGLTWVLLIAGAAIPLVLLLM
jgi:uncharacterized iron-regulated membrane protein